MFSATLRISLALLTWCSLASAFIAFECMNDDMCKAFGKTNHFCKRHKCVKIQCAIDSDCNNKAYGSCNNQRCKYLDCMQDSECTDSVNGYCSSNNKCQYLSSCSSDNDCNSHTFGYCDQGVCAIGECDSGADCPDGGQWKIATCNNH
eukprot:Awhi_evm1s9008